MQIKEIQGQPGYFAGQDGTIWSEKSGVRLKLRAFRRGPRGHMAVNLSQKGRYRLHSVHRLIAATFIGPAPSTNHVVMHSDDDPSNNADWNLSYGLPRENSAQMVQRGRSARGERTPWSKLTWATAREIRKRIAAGELQNRLAAEFGVSASIVCDLNLNRIWKED